MEYHKRGITKVLSAKYTENHHDTRAEFQYRSFECE
jgi:hypothetical protein